MSSDTDPFLAYPFANDIIFMTREKWLADGGLGLNDEELGRVQPGMSLSAAEILTMAYLAKLRVEQEVL